MSGPSAVFTDYAQLASKISQHLATHPGDRQAQDDLRYVLGKLRAAGPAANAQDMTDATGPTEANPGAAVAGGIAQGLLDIPRGIGQAVLHPLQAVGQLTGFGNVPAMVRAANDPEAGIGEKLDALIRATPLNLGYAPERALLEATGAKSDTPASLADQAHAATNVASLALLGVKPGSAVRLVTKPMGAVARAALSPVLDRILAAQPTAVAATDAPTGLLGAGLRESVVRANLAKQGYAPKLIDQIVARMRAVPAAPSDVPTPETDPAFFRPTLPTPPDPMAVPTYIRRGLLTPPGPAPLAPETLVGGDVGGSSAAQQAAEAQIARETAAGARGAAGSVRWSTTQLPDPGMNLGSAAALKQLRALRAMTPAQLRVALQNPLLAQFAALLKAEAS